MADQADVAVECIAEEARPPPKFTWFLGEDQLNVRINKENYLAYIIFYLLTFYNSSTRKICILFLKGEISVSTEDKESGKKNYIETLKYFPSEKHDGKTLRCQVEHQAYTDVQKEGKQNEAEVILKVQCKYYWQKFRINNRIYINCKYQ